MFNYINSNFLCRVTSVAPPMKNVNIAKICNAAEVNQMV